MRLQHGSTCMRLLLDECVGGKQLVAKLKVAGHDVVRSLDAIGGGAEDPVVFAFAQNEKRVIVTLNSRDFDALATVSLEHAGLILIYQDGDGRDMSYDDVVAAVANVENTHVDGISKMIVVLNQYRW